MPTPIRPEEEEEQIDIDPEQLKLITQKEWNIPQARGDVLPKLIANRVTLIHRAFVQVEFARTVEIGQFNTTNEFVMNGNSSTR